MKRFIVYCISIATIALQAAEQTDYSKYENLPARLFFVSLSNPFYIRTQQELGSQEAFDIFLKSKVIRDALMEGIGTKGDTQITISVLPEELKAFAKFAKNLTLPGWTKKMAYEDAFGDLNGIHIMQDLQVDPAFISEISLEIKSSKSLESPELPRKKPKLDNVPAVTQILPQVDMVVPGNKEKLSLSEEQVKHLKDIESIIADLIEHAENDPVVTVVLPEKAQGISNKMVNDFLNLMIKVYASGEQFKDSKALSNLFEYFFKNKIVVLDETMRYLDTFLFLANWFGYHNFGKKIEPLAVLLGIPLSLSKPSDESLQSFRELSNAYGVQWSTQNMPDIIENVIKITSLQDQLEPGISDFDILQKLIDVNGYLTTQKLDFDSLNDLVKKEILIASAFNYTALNRVLRNFYRLLNALQEIRFRFPSLPNFQKFRDPYERQATDAYNMALLNEAKEAIRNLAQNLGAQQIEEIVKYLQVFFMYNPYFVYILQTVKNELMGENKQ